MVSSEDRYRRQKIAVLDSEMSYVDTGSGEGPVVVFLHGNPTSSYLWRNVIPEVEGSARCLAPDLVGMGESAPNPSGAYRFVDHSRYLDAWLDTNWLTIKMFGHFVPVFPAWGMHNALSMHDVHHALTGYNTKLAGEAETAAWEIASGGCGFNLFFWIDRLVILLPAALIIPRRMFRAFRRGLGCRNLYRRRQEDVFATDFDELVRRVDPHGKLP